MRQSRGWQIWCCPFEKNITFQGLKDVLAGEWNPALKIRIVDMDFRDYGRLKGTRQFE